MDYYFICETVGTELSWEINRRIINFRSTNDNGTTRFDILPEYQYTSTLLSNQPNALNFDFVSLLVLSINSTQSSDFTIQCYNHRLELDQVRTSDNQSAQNEILNSDGSGLHLQYLFESTTLNNPVVRYYYVCGVDTIDLQWEFGNTSLVFDRSKAIGMTTPSSHMHDFSILIGRQPFLLVALLIRETPNIDVTCADTFHRRETITDLQIRTTAPSSTAITPNTPISPSDITTAPSGTCMLCWVSLFLWQWVVYTY